MPGFAIGVRVSFWDFNKPVVVEAPKESQLVPTEALLGLFLGGLKSDKTLQESVPSSPQPFLEPATTAPAPSSSKSK